uniref:syndecan-2-like isoform X2 n=1 Tax=Monopterus albus TaxID=43700 RepID=UPI0009B35465|nr:syndecan-2-like isoform X2 [Monopterus albus]
MRSLWLFFLVGLATGFISEKILVSSQTSFPMSDDMYLEGHTSGGVPIDDEDGQDDDSDSGSGSGDFDEEILRRSSNITFLEDMVPVQPQTTPGSPYNPPTTAADRQDQTTIVKTTPYLVPDGDNGNEEMLDIGPTADLFTESTTLSSTSATSVTKESDEDNSLERWNVSTPKDSGDESLTKEPDNEIVLKDDRGGRLYNMDSPEEVTSENIWERTEVLAVIACGVFGFLSAVFLLILLTYRMKKKDEGSYALGDTKLSTTAYHKAPTKEFYA